MRWSYTTIWMLIKCRDAPFEMKTWIILCVLCLLAPFYPGAELFCWDTAGNRIGTWSEIYCDGHSYPGTWTGYVTSDPESKRKL